jgi:RHS repeat-associated protein
VRKTTGGATTGYVWDGDDLAVELDGAGALVRAYSYYPGVDQPHSVTQQGGAVFRYAPELPGHVAGLVGAGNTVTNTYTHTPFGEPLTTNEQVPQPLRYMAREYDAETGLYYVRARYYDPQQGRFVSEDPIGLAGGINPYAYVENDPVNATDPSGLGPCDAWKITLMFEGDPRTFWMLPAGCKPDNTGNLGNPNARGGQFLSGLNSGSRNRDVGAGSSPTGQEDLAKIMDDLQHPRDAQCTLAVGLLIGQGVTDVAFFSGIGVAAKAGFMASNSLLIGRGLASSGNSTARVLGVDLTARGLVLQRGAVATGGATVSEYYMAPGLIENNLVQEAAGFGDFGWRDVVPGFATWEAYKQPRRCVGGKEETGRQGRETLPHPWLEGCR